MITKLLMLSNVLFINSANVSALAAHNLVPDDINFVVSTHGHSDHIGNNNLFLKAKHIVGFSISFMDTYYLFPFDQGMFRTMIVISNRYHPFSQ